MKQAVLSLLTSLEGRDTLKVLADVCKLEALIEIADSIKVDAFYLDEAYFGSIHSYYSCTGEVFSSEQIAAMEKECVGYYSFIFRAKVPFTIVIRFISDSDGAKVLMRTNIGYHKEVVLSKPSKMSETERVSYLLSGLHDYLYNFL